jgi:hypothetical protein
MQLIDYWLHVRGEPAEFNAIILTDVQPTISVAETHRLEQNYVMTQNTNTRMLSHIRSAIYQLILINTLMTFYKLNMLGQHC